MWTFWLYSGSRVLTAVRLPADSTDQQVRQKAIDSELRVPIGHIQGEAPFEFRNRLHRATVRTFS